MVNFMPKAAIYCPLLTIWSAEHQGLHCSKQPIPIGKAPNTIIKESTVILYEVLIIPGDKQHRAHA